jgi:hypothetical protein
MEKLTEAEREDKAQREAFTQNLIEAVRVCDRPLQKADQWAAQYDPDRAFRMYEQVTAARLRKAAAWLLALADNWPAEEDHRASLKAARDAMAMGSRRRRRSV